MSTHANPPRARAGRLAAALLLPVLLAVALPLAGCDSPEPNDPRPFQASGEVRNASRGEPLAGVEVWIWASLRQASTGVYYYVRVATTTTDADGRFTLGGEAPGEAMGLLLTVNILSTSVHLCGWPRAYSGGYEHGCIIDERYPGYAEDIPLGVTTGHRVRLHEYAPLVIRAVPASPPPPPDTWLYLWGGWGGGVFGTWGSGPLLASEGDSFTAKAKGGAMNPVHVRVESGGTLRREVQDSVFCPVGEETTYAVTY